MSWPQKLSCPSRRFLRAPASMTNEQCRELWRGFCLQMDEFEASLERMTPDERRAVLRPNEE